MIAVCILLATLTTTAEVNGLTPAECAAKCDVALTGTVTAVLHNRRYVLEDATGRAHVLDLSGARPSVGDLCGLRGMTGVDAFLQEQTIATETAVLGRGRAPAVVDETVPRIASGLCDFANVRVTGRVVECLRDDRSEDWSYFVLASDGGFVYVTVPDSATERFEPDRFTRAVVTVTGTVIPNHCGARRFVGPHVETMGPTSVRVVRAAVGGSKPLRIRRAGHLAPTEIVRYGQGEVEGRVLAAWGGCHVLVQSGELEFHHVELAPGTDLPAFGARIRATGLPETDLVHFNLSKARWRLLEPPRTEEVAVAPRPVEDISAVSWQVSFHGYPVRVRGCVLAEPCPQSDWRATVVADTRLRYTIDASRFPDLASLLVVGAVVEVTGCGLAETENWRPGLPFPVSKGDVIVVRRPEDVRVIERPPFWTPRRLSVLLLVIFAALVALAVWNRFLKRLVERRGRQLVRQTLDRAAAELRTEERTRLAVELHDSLSQTLTALACQIDSADSVRQKDPSRVASYLEHARRMIDSCRAELRNCLWDLRSHTLEETDAETAIRRTVVPHAVGAEVSVDFKIARVRFSDNTFHDVLCILRELAANAVRHGHARHIRIEGRLVDKTITVTVADDGCGFDPQNCPGSAEGHFGLMGVRERMRRHNGTLEVNSANGRGAVFTLTLMKMS